MVAFVAGDVPDVAQGYEEHGDGERAGEAGDGPEIGGVGAVAVGGLGEGVEGDEGEDAAEDEEFLHGGDGSGVSFAEIRFACFQAAFGGGGMGRGSLKIVNGDYWALGNEPPPLRLWFSGCLLLNGQIVPA